MSAAAISLGGFLRGWFAQRTARLPQHMPTHARAQLTACAARLRQLAERHRCMETDALADAVQALADGEPEAAAEAARAAQVLRTARVMQAAGA